jgi:uncharacterized membrane protein YphA (DoxX/SURF4 family)
MMAHPAGAQKATGAWKAQATALTVIRVTAGIYLFFMGVAKVRWLMDSTPLAAQLAAWSTHAAPLGRWYLERITPGTPVFARLVPLGEMVGGLALVVGFWTRMVAGAMFLMILNFQLAASAMFSYAYLTNANGLPLLGSLLGLMLGGGRLPLSLRK